MMTIDSMNVTRTSDAELVAQSLAGNRDAFRQIVERYQTLISSLAYCAVGDVTQSEDLAQETFVRAWKELPELREPSKLRPWLCSIIRFIICKEFRRQGHEPIDLAESLDVVDSWVSPEPLPSDRLITEEERLILWRLLERLPEGYREPLVLFYRQHQSIEAVAQDLELSEDVVRQRLSRGRKLVQEQLLSFVAGALKQTNPGKTFALGVVAALPVVGSTAKAATVTGAATKGGSAAKAASSAGGVSAFLSFGVMLLFSLFGVFGFLGQWIGRKMGRASQQSVAGRKRLIQFWRILAIGFLVFVLPVMLMPNSMIHSHRWIFRAQTWSLSAFYWLVAGALVIWGWQCRRGGHAQGERAMETIKTTDRAYRVWVALGMMGPVYIIATFLFALFCTDWSLSTNSIPETEALKIISERKDAEFTVYQYRDGSRLLSINLPEERRVDRTVALDKAVLSALADNGIKYPTRVEDLDFSNGGVRGWLVLLSTFIAVAGFVLLLRRRSEGAIGPEVVNA